MINDSDPSTAQSSVVPATLPTPSRPSPIPELYPLPGVYRRPKFVARLAGFALASLVGFAPVGEACAQTSAQEFQQLAVKEWPDLGVQGSELNQKFLELYQRRKTEDPAFFNNPRWPIMLGAQAAMAVQAAAAEASRSKGSAGSPAPVPVQDPRKSRAEALASQGGELLKKPNRTKEDLEQAAQLLAKAAELGDGRAALRLAKMYRVGDGVERSLSKAEGVVITASRAGYVPATFARADYAKTPGEYLRLVEEAARGGYLPAVAELKEIYSPGGGHSSFSTRQFHPTNPRDHGSAPAMQDAKRALMWSYVLKGLEGSPASNLSALTGKLSTEEVLNAEKEAQKFMADNKLGPSTAIRSESW